MAQKLYSNVPIAPCHLTNGTIKRLQENAHFLFTISDVKKILGDSFTARMVLEEVCDFFEDFVINDDEGPAEPMSVTDIDPFWDSRSSMASIGE